MAKQFTDSLHDSFELVQQLVRGMPGTAQKRAKTAAERMLDTWEKMKQEAPKDPAVAVGAAFAVFFIANEIVDAPKGDVISDSIIETVGR